MKIIKIKDYYGNYQEVPVDDALYEEWLDLQREEDRIKKLEAYHRHAAVFDETLSAFTKNTGSIDELLVAEETSARLHAAIEQLTPIQQRRVLMYMERMSYTDIAKAEGKQFYAIHKSLNIAFQRLRLLMGE